MGVRSASGAEGIFTAARDLFAERGFDAVSVSAIATRAGSSKANVFHHFGSKEGLYNEIMRSAVDRMTEEFQRAFSSGTDASTRVENAIRGSLTVLFEDPARADLVFREVVESDASRGKALADELFNGVYTTLTHLFEDGVEDGANPLESNFLAFLLIASNLMLFHCRHVVCHLPANAFITHQDQYIHMLRDMLMGGWTNTAGGRA